MLSSCPGLLTPLRIENDPSMGERRPASPHSVPSEVDDARAVPMAAGPGAALIGHSFGGAIALETARLAASKRSGASSSTSPACASADSYRPTRSS